MQRSASFDKWAEPQPGAPHKLRGKVQAKPRDDTFMFPSIMHSQYIGHLFQVTGKGVQKTRRLSDPQFGLAGVRDASTAVTIENGTPSVDQVV